MPKKLTETTVLETPETPDAHVEQEEHTPQTEHEEHTEPLPAWLHPDDDLMPPAALQPIYGKLPQEVTHVCETARKNMRDGFIEDLRTVRDALAPYGLFKDWYERAGFVPSYQAIVNALSRADRTTRQPEQPDGQHDVSSTPASGSGGGRKTHSITIKFASDDEAAEAKRLLRDCELLVFGTSEDKYGAVLLHVLSEAKNRAGTPGPEPEPEPENTPEEIRRRLQAVSEANGRTDSVAEQPAVAFLSSGDEAYHAEGTHA